MSTIHESIEYTVMVHAILVAISVFVLIVQFIHVNVNFEMFEKRLLQLLERIESLENEQYKLHQTLFPPSEEEKEETIELDELKED
jgi:hypothetical protein